MFSFCGGSIICAEMESIPVGLTEPESNPAVAL